MDVWLGLMSELKVCYQVTVLKLHAERSLPVIADVIESAISGTEQLTVLPI